MMNNKGITLIEVLIVTTIIGILVVALGFNFQGWVSGYKAESQTKEIYIDLINTRARAMQRNRMHFIDLAVDQYNIYEDDNPAPGGNGNGTPEPAIDTPVSQPKILEARYPIIWSTPGDTSVEFNTNGLSSVNKSICSNTDFIPENPSPSGADYDCIIISTTRINLGQLRTSIPDGGVCASPTSGGDCVEK